MGTRADGWAPESGSTAPSGPPVPTPTPPGAATVSKINLYAHEALGVAADRLAMGAATRPQEPDLPHPHRIDDGETARPLVRDIEVLSIRGEADIDREAADPHRVDDRHPGDVDLDEVARVLADPGRYRGTIATLTTGRATAARRGLSLGTAPASLRPSRSAGIPPTCGERGLAAGGQLSVAVPRDSADR